MRWQQIHLMTHWMRYKLLGLLAFSILGSQALAQDNASVFQSVYQERPGAILRWLDKATARTGTLEISRDETIQLDTVSVRLKACRAQDPIEGGEQAAFLQIWQREERRDPTWIFSGWMYASHPGVAAMDHAVMDVWLLSCQDAISNELEPDNSDSDETDGQIADSDEAA